MEKIKVILLSLFVCLSLVCCTSGDDITRSKGKKNAYSPNNSTALSDELRLIEDEEETKNSDSIKSVGNIGDTGDADNTDSAAAYADDSDIKEDGYYYDLESVVLYLYYYDRLPDNYITKKEAKSLGWSGGSVEPYYRGGAIGGDRFGNYEGQLPTKKGRQYTECDIDTKGMSKRGAKRLIFSNDGLYFYTKDHYSHFDEVYVSDSGEVIIE